MSPARSCSVVVLVFGVLALSARPAAAATYVVSLASDPVPAGGVLNCEVLGSLTPGTLRWAVVSANANAGSDVISSTSLTGTIVLNSTCKGLVVRDAVSWLSNLNLTISGSSMGSGSLVTVEAPGRSITIKSVVLVGSGVASQRGVDAVAGSLTMTKGAVRGMRLGPVGPGFDGAGIKGSIIANIELVQMLIYQNVTDANAGDGGGVHFSGTGRLTIRESLISHNQSGASGGGVVYAATGSSLGSSIKYSTIWKNTAWGNAGGGVFIVSGGNPTFVMQNVTIHENSSDEVGAGIEIIGDSPVELLNSTVSDNVLFDPVAGAGTQINQKGSATTYVLGSIISGANSVCGWSTANIVGPLNLWSDTSCTALTGLPSTNPLLGPLQNNGGSCGSTNFPCYTRKPGPTSPAIGAATTCNVSDDQRHMSRGPAPCWIGAYED